MKDGIVTKADFAAALIDLGHDPYQYQGKRLSLQGMASLYELHEDSIIDAIDGKLIAAHYDYRQDTIWIDALEAAYFFYCLNADTELNKQWDAA
jgi:hypothetical protein